MDYTESICFSAAPAEMLNKKAFQLSRNLYMFAYYDPKPYCENESSRSKFLTAIINLYGLFWDCGPFFFKLLYSQDSILISDWIRVQTRADFLKRCISAFRSVYCHNNSTQLPLNEEKSIDAENWAISHSCTWQGIHETSEEEWKRLLNPLIAEADFLISDINVAIDTLISTEDNLRRERAIEKWVQEIARGYQKNPDYLLNTMAGLYQLYLLNSNQSLNSRQELRFQTRRWLYAIVSDLPEVWHEKWLKQRISESGDPNDITNSRIYAILKDWPNKWAEWYDRSVDECNEAPLPASIFFRILANDVNQYAQNPSISIDG